MLNIANKILQSSLVIYGASFIKQVAQYPTLAPTVLTKIKKITMFMGDCKYEQDIMHSLYHLSLQDIKGIYNTNQGTCGSPYYEQLFSIQKPLAKLAIDGVKATAGCILGKLLAVGIWGSDASLGNTVATSALCGGIMAAITPKNHNIPYIQNLTLHQFPLEYDIIGSAAAAGLLALTWYVDTKESIINEEISDSKLYEDDYILVGETEF